MRGNCRYLPTVEECQAAADHYIEDECLRECVSHLCVVGRPKCDEAIQLRCAIRKAEGKAESREVGGYVPLPRPDEPPRTCKHPKEDMDWCELPRSPNCQAQFAVHEYAHDCGWHHEEGKGVPGNHKGEINCL